VSDSGFHVSPFLFATAQSDEIGGVITPMAGLGHSSDVVAIGTANSEPRPDAASVRTARASSPTVDHAGKRGIARARAMRALVTRAQRPGGVLHSRSSR
jgi:hypothetical protein